MIKIEKDREEIKKLASNQPCDCAKIETLISSLHQKSKELSSSFNKWTVS